MLGVPYFFKFYSLIYTFIFYFFLFTALILVSTFKDMFFGWSFFSFGKEISSIIKWNVFLIWRGKEARIKRKWKPLTISGKTTLRESGTACQAWSYSNNTFV